MYLIFVWLAACLLFSVVEFIIQQIWHIKPNFGYRVIGLMNIMLGQIVMLLFLSYFGVI